MTKYSTSDDAFPAGVVTTKAAMGRRQPEATGTGMTVYLAGPGVFLKNAIEHGRRLTALAEEFGLTGLYPIPLTNDLGTDLTASVSVSAASIRKANCRMIELTSGVLADMTPFRGVSMDVGTAFEIGYAQALGKPVIGYVSNPSMLKDYKTRYLNGAHPKTIVNDAGETVIVGPDGMTVEDFGLNDNLMVSAELSGLFPDVKSAMKAMSELLNESLK